MDSVAKTSLLTAAMRAAETKRTDAEGRLFFDPYAELLAGAEGIALLARAIAESGDQPAIAVRTYYLDQKIATATANGARQIVMLAAGMDTRAFRLQFPEGVRLFELDRPEVLTYKRERLIGVAPRCIRTELAVDLREEWTKNLRQAGFNGAGKTVWLIEGLLMYMNESEVLTLFKQLNSLAATGDILLLDVLSRSLLESPHMAKQLQFLKKMGAPWKFGIDDPERFFAELGWDASVSQTGEVVPSRWPFPVAPRSVPNVPRGFLVEATKK